MTCHERQDRETNRAIWIVVTILLLLIAALIFLTVSAVGQLPPFPGAPAPKPIVQSPKGAAMTASLVKVAVSAPMVVVSAPQYYLQWTNREICSWYNAEVWQTPSLKDAAAVDGTTNIPASFKFTGSQPCTNQTGSLAFSPTNPICFYRARTVNTNNGLASIWNEN